MIDIHSHILYEIDDGSRSIEESISILKKLYAIGFVKVIATPHYIVGSKFIANNKQKRENLQKIKEKLAEEKIPLEIYLGNEIYIDSHILSLIENEEITSLNESKYLLIEFPIAQEINEIFEILFRIHSKGFIPIIAHPERYIFLQKNPKLINEFLNAGYMFQGNIANVIGKYGESAKKLFFHMLKENQYQFLATDIHFENDCLFINIDKIKKEIKKRISEEKLKELLETNPLKILENKTIEIEKTSEPIKRKWFFKRK